MYLLQTNLIFNFVVYDWKCPILSPIYIRKTGPVMPSLKRIRCVTREEKLFQTRVRCFQHSSLSRAPSASSTPTRSEHLTLARNSSFSPLVAQCTIFEASIRNRFEVEAFSEKTFDFLSVSVFFHPNLIILI